MNNIGAPSHNIKRRMILNEEELLPYLYKVGFEKIYLEDYSVENKIKLFQETITVVGPMGGGLSFISFMKEGSKVVEILPKKPTQWCNQFIQIGKALNLNFTRFFDLEVKNNDNMIVNIEKLMKVIKS